MGIYDFACYVVAVITTDGNVHYRSFNDIDDAQDVADDAVCDPNVIDVCIYEKTCL